MKINITTFCVDCHRVFIYFFFYIALIGLRTKHGLQVTTQGMFHIQRKRKPSRGTAMRMTVTMITFPIYVYSECWRIIQVLLSCLLWWCVYSKTTHNLVNWQAHTFNTVIKPGLDVLCGAYLQGLGDMEHHLGLEVKGLFPDVTPNVYFLPQVLTKVEWQLLSFLIVLSIHKALVVPCKLGYVWVPFSQAWKTL